MGFKQLTTTSLFAFFLSMALNSCKKCYECNCYLNGNLTIEERCEKGINSDDRSTVANRYEQVLEDEKGYDDCECIPK